MEPKYRTLIQAALVAVILVVMTINHRTERVPENTAQVLATN